MIWPNDGRKIFRNIVSLNVLVHDVIKVRFCAIFV